MTNQTIEQAVEERAEEFDEQVGIELGYVSALFMSQECKGTEIVMPTQELTEVMDRIGLYSLTAIQQARLALLTELKDYTANLKGVYSAHDVQEAIKAHLDELIKATK